MRAVVVCAIVLAFYGLAYRHVLGRLGWVAEKLTRGSRIEALHGERDVNDAVKLTAAGLAQAVLAMVLWLAVGAPTGAWDASTPLLAVAGLAIGLAELGLATTLCHALLLTRPSGAAHWLVESRGGWMRQFRAAARVAHPTAAVGVVVLYVTGEEVIFRLILLEVLAPAGDAAAVGIATALFVVVQVFGMPSLRAALFPMVGACVVGVTHAALYLQVPNLLPLIIAHTVFLIGALAPAGDRRAAVQVRTGRPS